MAGRWLTASTMTASWAAVADRLDDALGKDDPALKAAPYAEACNQLRELLGVGGSYDCYHFLAASLLGAEFTVRYRDNVQVYGGVAATQHGGVAAAMREVSDAFYHSSEGGSLGDAVESLALGDYDGFSAALERDRSLS